MELTDDDKRVLDERNFPEKLKEMIEDMPKDDIMKIHDFAEYVLIKERVREADKKSGEKLTDKEISEIAEKGSFDGKMTEHIDYAKETDYLIAGYKWKRDNGLNERKYELTDETIEFNGHTLHRIRALKDIGDVKKGNLGGFIESEKNLSLKDNCWVGDEAKVFENARVNRDAQVFGKAVVFGNAEVYGKADVHGEAKVYGSASVYENAVVKGNAEIGGWGTVKGNAEISEGKVIIETVYGTPPASYWKNWKKNPELD